MMKISESFSKLAHHRPRKAWPGGGILQEEVMGLSRPPTHLPFKINEKAGIEKKAAQAQGLSGGRSSCWEASSR